MSSFLFPGFFFFFEKGHEINGVDAFGNGDSVLIIKDEESARQVPTGPDPLHHNDNPIRP